jgi:hypothetical protein
MLRGIRRLFGFLAIVWFLLTGATLFTNIPNKGHAVGVVLIGTVIIYSIGWAITYLADGFKKPRGRIIDL